ncbi:MAG: ATP-binding protein, partial [Nitrospira sp.]|nr:ATP-binding protein [Nitrospira sp.]
QDVVQKFQLVAEKKKIKLRANFRPDLPFIWADIGLIERVLENLIENALRYTPEGGTVTIALILEKEQSYQTALGNRGGSESAKRGFMSSYELLDNPEKITVQVTDTGCGIPPEDLPYIFDRFYRVQKRHREKSEGAGLGLAITKRILKLHRSSIEVNSTVGVSTAFIFHLPVYPS